MAYSEPVLVTGTTVHTGRADPPLPGDPVSMSSRVVDAASGLLQSFRPISAVREHLTDILHYRRDTARQIAVHEFVTHLSEDFGQVLLFDSDTYDARLVGVQFVISKKLFDNLPEAEKSLWAPMDYAVGSGVVVAPGVPTFAEKQLLTRLRSSYAKSWIFWHVDDGNAVPAGYPALADPYTAPSQVRKDVLEARNRALGYATAAKQVPDWETDVLLGNVDPQAVAS